ncbi:DUF2141 domain-containing protein [Paraferrimonas haliotis]|uniref:DUF2141 domain-containing protein n=1 Tax=Paraferrimonas haliotis TaxID=2013866 RepID=A0AA37WXS0_9GAMM|nr:DUF2141 domain-containing protein [Paraferrimonas haliotis]GLS84677.1 hypothetical protein GCM10007894_26540 [Paraferrimonas haliotis]
MIARILLITLLYAATISSAYSAPLTLSFNGLSNDHSKLVVQIYASKASWLDDDPQQMALFSLIDPAQLSANGSIEVELEFGDYAIYAYQDLDDNGELNSNWIGIPTEPVGTSNAAKGFMGPPKYDDAKFIFTKDHQQIQLTLVEI